MFYVVRELKSLRSKLVVSLHVSVLFLRVNLLNLRAIMHRYVSIGPVKSEGARIFYVVRELKYPCFGFVEKHLFSPHKSIKSACHYT